jgi:hypothetical protein
MKMNMEHWWSVVDRGIPKYLEKNVINVRPYI